MDCPRVVGVKQLCKAIGRDEICRVFLADDADPAITEPVEALAGAQDIPVTRVVSMKELGRACGIMVGASAAGLLKQSSMDTCYKTGNSWK
ncbi:MAG: ribosomal L7Ae/L30e/S12e/Gadd45 family protein [Oscillospiraceae bacterium]|nr:ribosomal L7Ae/L30e/S12e/Gadd45 family protein [Oscillospiraceae bacterium]